LRTRAIFQLDEFGKADPCLGVLPGVLYACCGHGDKPFKSGYIAFENGVTVRFEELETVEFYRFNKHNDYKR
jgi:hypothetical protein